MEKVEDTPNLSTQQLEVLKLVAQGQTDDEIAVALRLRKATVKCHLRRVYRKLGARNRTHAVACGHQYDLLPNKLQITKTKKR